MNHSFLFALASLMFHTALAFSKDFCEVQSVNALNKELQRTGVAYLYEGYQVKDWFLYNGITDDLFLYCTDKGLINQLVELEYIAPWYRDYSNGKKRVPYVVGYGIKVRSLNLKKFLTDSGYSQSACLGEYTKN